MKETFKLSVYLIKENIDTFDVCLKKQQENVIHKYDLMQNLNLDGQIIVAPSILYWSNVNCISYTPKGDLFVDFTKNEYNLPLQEFKKLDESELQYIDTRL